MTDWLADTLVATSALMLLVLVLREPVRQRFGAAAAYSLWLIPAARMVMPSISKTVERVVPAAEPVAAVEGAALLAPASLPVQTTAEPASLVDLLGGWTSIALAIWIAGSIAMLLRGALEYRRQRHLVLASGAQLARLGAIRIVRSEAVRGPLAFGFLDRVIAIPADFDHRFDERQRRLALDHELAHHRAGDLYANLIAYVLLCLQWFNPLAWVSHAAFRFDQEAACDARVLDKARPDDRLAYGQAIAKAASGRALLFASALDRPSTLQRRLKSMVTRESNGRRVAGKVLVVGALVVVLPLTATKAINYIDVPAAPEAPSAPAALTPAIAPAAPGTPLAPTLASAPLAPQAPSAPAAALAPHAPGVPHVPHLPAIAPKPPKVPVAPAVASYFQGGGNVTIKGKNKNWDDLTPEERREVRAALAEAREDIRKARAEHAQAMAEARKEMHFDREKVRRELAKGRAEIAKALADVERDEAKLRAEGKDPEQVKMALRHAQKAMQEIDVEKIVADAMASVDWSQIEGSIAQAERKIADQERELDRLEGND